MTVWLFFECLVLARVLGVDILRPFGCGGGGGGGSIDWRCCACVGAAVGGRWRRWRAVAAVAYRARVRDHDDGRRDAGERTRLPYTHGVCIITMIIIIIITLLLLSSLCHVSGIVFTRLYVEAMDLIKRK